MSTSWMAPNPNPGLTWILSSKEVAFVVNPYEAPATIPGISEKFIVDAQTLSIMRKPGLAMAIQGWILAAIYCVCLLVVLLLGERRDLLEMGIPLLFVLILAIQLARCGKSTMRFESRQMAYVGALLSILLFLPLGIFICLWIASSLNRVEILDAKRRNLVDQ